MTKEELIKAFVNGYEGKNHDAKVTVKDNGQKVLTLHQTDIANLLDGVLVLNTGGWDTATTKSYMNLVLKELNSSWGIIQRKGKWILQQHRGEVIVKEVLWNTKHSSIITN